MFVANADYSETVTVTHEGPCRYDNYKARAWTSSNRQYRHEVRFASRFVPVSYRITVVAHADDDALNYQEFVLLKPRTVVMSSAETVFNFPREINRRNCVSTTTFDPFGRRRTYRAALFLQANVISVIHDDRSDEFVITSFPAVENAKMRADSPQEHNNNNDDCITKNNCYSANKELLINPHETNSHKLID